MAAEAGSVQQVFDHRIVVNEWVLIRSRVIVAGRNRRRFPHCRDRRNIACQFLADSLAIFEYTAVMKPWADLILAFECRGFRLGMMCPTGNETRTESVGTAICSSRCDDHRHRAHIFCAQTVFLLTTPG